MQVRLYYYAGECCRQGSLKFENAVLHFLRGRVWSYELNAVCRLEQVRHVFERLFYLGNECVVAVYELGFRRLPKPLSRQGAIVDAVVWYYEGRKAVQRHA